MDDFLSFLSENWELLVLASLIIINIIILILKKAKVIKGDTVFTKVLEALPGFINQAEIDHPEAKSGRVKYSQVFLAAASLYRKLSGTDIPDDFIQKFDDAVEGILACPQKKN